MKNQMKNQPVKFVIIGFLAAILAAFNQTAAAQETALDYTFGTNGRVITDLGSSFDAIRSVAVQTDGKIIVAGQGPAPSSLRATVARYNANGSLDGTFGTNGVSIINLIDPSTGSPFGTTIFRKVLIQPDGKILLVSDAEFRSFIVVRINADATFDTTFGTGGRVVTPIPNARGNNSAFDALLQPDGKIVVCGDGIRISGNRTLFTLARYNTNGTLDNSFGTSGIVSTEFSSSTSSDAEPRSLALLPDGKILAAGSAATPLGSFAKRAALARYNSNGTLDSTFGTGGLATDNPGGVINEIAVQADGKIIAANGGFSGSGFGLTRYNADGSVDQTFGEFGRINTVFPAGSNGVTTEILIQPDGKILAGGYLVPLGWVLARYEANGTLDRTFGTGGRVQVNNVPTSNSNDPRSYDFTLQPDGKILFGGGEGFGDFHLVRLKARNVATQFDFDGDGRADVGVYRPSNGTWYLNQTTGGFYAAQFGVSADVSVPADYDGDGKTDIAVWRAGDFGYFYILSSSNNTFRAEQFGKTGDNPTLAGDWDADGKADLAVYRGGVQSFFYYRPSSQPGTNFVGIQWGTNGDTPIYGDFDGDAKLDAAVYRPGQNTFYVRQSSNSAIVVKQWGNAQTDAIFAGDFDGDGKSDFAVQRFIGSDAGTWYVAQSGGTNRAFQWGTGSDLPVPADYDGDGKTDFAVFRRSNGTWYIFQSATNAARATTFGASNDFPLPLNLMR